MIIFGYGSLMNKESLRKTIKNVGEIRPATLKGYRRVFNLRAKRMISECGPVAVLDIEKRDNNLINGVYFEVDKSGLELLKEREILYGFIEVDIISEGEGLKKALTVQARGKPRTKYIFDCDLQKKYLDVCLRGAKDFGVDFYNTFLSTTFIEGKNLIEHSNKLDL